MVLPALPQRSTTVYQPEDLTFAITVYGCCYVSLLSGAETIIFQASLNDLRSLSGAEMTIDELLSYILTFLRSERKAKL